MARPLVAAIALALLAAGAVAVRATEADLVARGHALAVRNCGACHAVAREGESPLPAAPPFRTLKTHYPVETLAESLAEGIISGHPEMPERAFAPEEIDALIAYLETL